jgi:GABA(A) receptor-associated protein
MNEKEAQHNVKLSGEFDPKNYTQDAANRILTKYKRRVPVLIWEQGPGIDMRKRKFIVPIDITLGQFLYVLRKQIKNITEAEGIFIFVTQNNAMLPVASVMSTIYDQHNIDGFLRFTVTKENTFG